MPTRLNYIDHRDNIINNNDGESSLQTSCNNIQVTSFNNATKTLLATTVVLGIFLAIQVFIVGVLAIWILKHRQRRRLRPNNIAACWSLPLCAQQPLQQMQQQSQRHWQGVPRSNSLTHLAPHDNAHRVAQSRNSGVRLDSTLIGSNRQELSG